MKTAGIFTTELDEHHQPIWHLPSGRRVAAEQTKVPQSAN
jgi:hypothetical protein